MNSADRKFVFTSIHFTLLAVVYVQCMHVCAKSLFVVVYLQHCHSNSFPTIFVLFRNVVLSFVISFIGLFDFQFFFIFLSFIFFALFLHSLSLMKTTSFSIHFSFHVWELLRQGFYPFLSLFIYFFFLNTKQKHDHCSLSNLKVQYKNRHQENTDIITVAMPANCNKTFQKIDIENSWTHTHAKKGQISHSVSSSHRFLLLVKYLICCFSSHLISSHSIRSIFHLLNNSNNSSSSSSTREQRK